MPLKRANAVPSTQKAQVSDTSPDEDEDEDALPTQAIRTGWSAGKQTMESTADFAQAFKPEANMQVIQILDDAPYANWRRHWIERRGATGLVTRPYTCPQTWGKDCPLCKVGDKVQGVSSFNIAVIGDDGVPMLKTWDVGVKLFGVLANYNADPKIGPLTKGYYGVSKSGTSGGRGSGGNVQTNVSPISRTALKADYGIEPPTPQDLARLGKYAADVIKQPKRGELEEIAQELASAFD